MSLTTGLLFEQKLRRVLEEEIEARKEEMSRGIVSPDFQRAVGYIYGLRFSLEMCDLVSKEVRLTL